MSGCELRKVRELDAFIGVGRRPPDVGPARRPGAPAVSRRSPRPDRRTPPLPSMPSASASTNWRPCRTRKLSSARMTRIVSGQSWGVATAGTPDVRQARTPRETHARLTAGSDRGLRAWAGRDVLRLPQPLPSPSPIPAGAAGLGASRVLVLPKRVRRSRRLGGGRRHALVDPAALRRVRARPRGDRRGSGRAAIRSRPSGEHGRPAGGGGVDRSQGHGARPRHADWSARIRPDQRLRLRAVRLVGPR